MHRLACSQQDATRLVLLADETGNLSMRSPFARDRDRIVFSRGFRRLARKTQVYLAGATSEHLRTRLTHTLEVAQIAKAMAYALDMSCDLTEAIAFGHDVGHPPFGHAGEQQLNRILLGNEPLTGRIAHALVAHAAGRDNGGFKHNLQSVRLLTLLEEYHPGYDGLNLTIQCLEGILKHTKVKWSEDADSICVYPDGGTLWSTLINDKSWCRTIEGQIVSLADDIAQVGHDLSDAVEANVLPLDELLALEGVRHALEAAQSAGKVLDFSKIAGPIEYRRNVTNAQVLSSVIDYFVRATIAELKTTIASLDAKDKQVCGPLAEKVAPAADFEALKEFKDNLVINSYHVNRMDNKGQYLIRRLVDAYLSDPRQLPDTVLKRYLTVKYRELEKKREAGFVTWLRRAKKLYRIIEPLTDTEEQSVIRFIALRPDGPAFRRLSAALLNKVTVYVALDGDYVRSVVDHIAGMTDDFAEQEVGRLYH